jgi:hypothetical protein
MKTLKSCVLVGFLLVFAISSAQAQIPPSQRAALIALYNATNGGSWNNSWGWKLPPLAPDGFAMPGTESGWYGVGVAGDQVVSLDLSYNNLTGYIPSPQLGDLTYLDYLNLSVNQLAGTILGGLGRLKNLHVLALDSNLLTGIIPGEFTTMVSLNLLELSGNQLSGDIPIGLGNLTNLTHLGLGGNGFWGNIPPELGNLTSLQELDLSGNLLGESIPSQLGNLSNLGFLNLSGNQLTGCIPAELGDFDESLASESDGQSVDRHYPG